MPFPCRDEAPTSGRAAGSRSSLSQGWELPGSQTLPFLPEAKYQGHLARGEAIAPKPVCSRVPEDTEQGHTLSLNASAQMQCVTPDLAVYSFCRSKIKQRHTLPHPALPGALNPLPANAAPVRTDANLSQKSVCRSCML